MEATYREKLLALVKAKGILRTKDLTAANIPRTILSRMMKNNELKRISRGIYTLPGIEHSENISLSIAGKKVSAGIVCLLSSLAFYEITTQAPFEVWMAIGEKDKKPKVDYPPIRFVRFGEEALSAGFTRQIIDNVEVKIFNPAKTVADCFKYRYKIGIEVAIEALKDCLANKICTVNEIWKYAKICRVAKVMKPYLEALI